MTTPQDAIAALRALNRLVPLLPSTARVHEDYRIIHAALGAEAETPDRMPRCTGCGNTNPADHVYGERTCCPDCEHPSGHWVDLASPETAEALARALRSIPVPSTYEEWQARVDATYEDDAAAILAAMRETGR